MTRLATTLAALLLLSACTRPRDGRAPSSVEGHRDAAAPSVAARAEVRVASRGAVTALAVAATMLTFCDERGQHEIGLPSGREQRSGGPCPTAAARANSTEPPITVRTPDLGPDDIVEIEGVAQSFPIAGHARDWAFAGQTAVIATGSQVLRIDTRTNQRDVLSPRPAERVAVGGGWAAWWDGDAVIVAPL